MTVTYHHDHVNTGANPAPLTHDALARVGTALEAAARGDGPLARASCASTPRDARRVGESGVTLIPVMGSKLSPSPELHGAGAGVLEIDYADGSTRTFDVDAFGKIEARRYAYALALVFETDRPLTDEERDAAIDECTLPDSLGASIQYASTPDRIPLNTGNYSMQLRDERDCR